MAEASLRDHVRLLAALLREATITDDPSAGVGALAIITRSPRRRHRRRDTLPAGVVIHSDGQQLMRVRVRVRIMEASALLLLHAMVLVEVLQGEGGGAFACAGEAAHPFSQHPGNLRVRHDGHAQGNQVEEHQVGGENDGVPREQEVMQKIQYDQIAQRISDYTVTL